jgi:hypothetical protein
MSQLGDLENALVLRLSEARSGGSLVFATVRGASGGYRPAIRDALARERMPAVYVGFTDEPTAPETKPAVRGARFVVLVAARALRIEDDPRYGGTDSPGAFALLEIARAQLDGYEPGYGSRAVCLHQKFVEADDRTAVYELLYRLWPISQTALTFGEQKIADGAVRMSLEIGPLAVEHAIIPATDAAGDVRHVSWVRGRPIVWRGQLRASSDSELNTIEAELQELVLSREERDVADDSGRVFAACILDRFALDGPRRPCGNGKAVVQDVELRFMQHTQAGRFTAVKIASSA